MADISKFDDVSKLQTYEDYIANNITEWEVAHMMMVIAITEKGEKND